MHACIHAYVHGDACLSMYIPTYTHKKYMHTLMHVWLHIENCQKPPLCDTYMYALVHIHASYIYIHIHACLPTYIHIYIYTTYMHACMHAYVHGNACLSMYIPTYTHTKIHAYSCMSGYIHTYIVYLKTNIISEISISRISIYLEFPDFQFPEI